MAAYGIGSLEIADPTPLAEDNQHLHAIVERFRGHIVGAGPVVQVLEGEIQPHLAVDIPFGTAVDATRWYESAEYGAIRGLRQGSGKTNVWLVDATAMPWETHQRHTWRHENLRPPESFWRGRRSPL